jgi:hypothetical protein
MLRLNMGFKNIYGGRLLAKFCSFPITAWLCSQEVSESKTGAMVRAEVQRAELMSD